MKKTITIAAYNRPDHLRMLLDSLRAQLLPLRNFQIIVSVDAGGDKFCEVMEIAKSIDFVSSQVFHTAQNQGTNHNTFWLMDYVFDILGTDWNVYLEDDLVLSPDAFNLVEWYIEHAEELRNYGDISDIGAYCLCRLRVHGAPENIYLSRAFVGWGFLMAAHQWETYAKPAWFNPKKMWDTSLATYIREQGPKILNAFPELSRITNTGRGGVHFTPEKYDALMQNHKYNQSHEEYPFELVGEVGKGENSLC